jgi:hypothetical protein
MEHPPFLSRVAFNGLPGLVIETLETIDFDSPVTSTNGSAFCILMEDAGSKLALVS